MAIPVHTYINYRRSPMSDSLRNVFAYGSLMYPEVIYKIVKRHDYAHEPVLLRGYARRHVKNKPYPGLIVQEGSQVWGVLYRGVEQGDVNRLHCFEGTEYLTHEVEVETKQGEGLKAFAYLYADPENLEPREWDVDTFQREHKLSFAESHLQSSR